MPQVIAGKPGTGKSVLIEKVGRAALERGFFVAKLRQRTLERILGYAQEVYGRLGRVY